MPKKNKSVRLSKATREFNVGLQTLVEYLGKKGIEVEANPNAKIDSEAYDLLKLEFSDSKELKEKARKAGVSTGKRETVTLDVPKKESKKDDGEEFLIKTVPGTGDTIIADVPEEKKPGVKVLGKIDVEEKTRKPKKAQAPKEEKAETPAEEKAKAEDKKPEKQAEVKTEAKKKEKTESAEEEKKKQEDEVIRGRAEKIQQPKVLGTIDLPEERRKRKPVISTDPDTETQKGRRKRKRIRPKVDVAKDAKGKKGKPSRNERRELSKEDIDQVMKDTMAKLHGGTKSKAAKARRQKREEHRTRIEERELQEQEESKTLKLTEFVTVSDLANMMDVTPTDVISACMSLGIMASINQRLDAETLTIIAEEFGFEVEFVKAEAAELIETEEDKPEDLVPRAPIVTVMGHVDHGKTSLLDFIRNENVIGGEAGGITQHIGAYRVELPGGKHITFLDTPGHEAFTAMRARGAQITDLAIIVIAADDEVMPQTKEAINHAQAAGIPIVFAINKIDKESANPDKIKEQLAAMNILVEDWGGKYQSQEISAKKGTNVPELLEKVLLEAELLDLKANPNKNAVGTVIESTLDKGRGYVTTLLVEAGTLRMGDVVLAGHFTGRVKALFNERGKPLKEIGPASPVSMLGLNGAANAGDRFNVVSDEREARMIATRREQLQREQGVRTQKHITLDEIGRRIAIGDFKELNIIIKGDVDGSVEALSDSLEKLSTDKIQVNVIHRAVGQITENDVSLASASDAIIVGFQVRPSLSARKLAEKEEIQIKIYSVIYAAIEEIRAAMEGMLSAKIEEKIQGTAEIRETFHISKVGTVAGCFVTDGKITRNSNVRVIRDGIVVYTGELGSLKRFKDDVKEVTKGYECGLNIAKFNDIKVGDIIEAFEEVEVKQTLGD